MACGFTVVPPSLWSHVNSLKWKTSIRAHRVYLCARNSLRAARTCVSLSTHNPPWSQRWKQMINTLPWRSSQSSQRSSELPATANNQRQPLGPAHRVIQGQAEKPGVRGVRSPAFAESFQQIHPGSSDLCACSSAGTGQPCWAQHTLTLDQMLLLYFSRSRVN